MNEKRAKRLRKALLPGREDTGMSRGAFMRGVKDYTDTNVKGFVLEFPEVEPGQGRPEFRWTTQTTRLTDDSPRAMYKRFKRAVNGQH